MGSVENGSLEDDFSLPRQAIFHWTHGLWEEGYRPEKCGKFLKQIWDVFLKVRFVFIVGKPNQKIKKIQNQVDISTEKPLMLGRNRAVVQFLLGIP